MIAVAYHTTIASDEAGIYAKCWRLFYRSAKRFGIDVVHVTCAGHDDFECDERVQIDGIDYERIVMARDAAMARYLEQLPDRRLRFMCEPDSVFQGPPPIISKAKDIDLALVLRRRGRNIPVGVRWANRKAAPVFDRAVEFMETLNTDLQTWHGDVRAWHKIIGVDPKRKTSAMRHFRPGKWRLHGLRFQLVESDIYGIDYNDTGEFVQQFKGPKRKLAMLKEHA